ncbi:MAG TPA: nuclear transport factor 2 family protein [Sphingomonas sp.]|jgi:ketosteroid isomerase-like protein|uniref:nuclear transport factor 2 family protein n=1 Tax=Sphingomonas sp. TaxID=28214 RepID=UPI002EDB219F
MAFEGPIEDRLAIRELLDAYADAVCRNDPDDWGATWADDAVWSLPDYPEIGEVHGRAAIVEMWNGAMAHYPGIIFTTTPGAILVDGDRAIVRSWTSEVYDRDGITKRDRGRYDDVCVKQNDRWAFASRTFTNIHRA